MYIPHRNTLRNGLPFRLNNFETLGLTETCQACPVYSLILKLKLKYNLDKFKASTMSKTMFLCNL